MRGLFADCDVIRVVDSEPLLLLGGGRALLMQLAHPAVAEGVARHSEFAAHPFARLAHTVQASSAIVFGSEADAREAAAMMRSVHEGVRGPGYDACDPELMMWVHATLVDTALCVYERFLRPLTSGEARRYYQQSATVADVLGVPRRAQPPNLAAFRTYVEATTASLAVSTTAGRLAESVLHPPVWRAAEPALVLGRQLTAGLLPPALRRQYGLAWDCPRQVALALTSVASRVVLRRVPAPLRRAPGVLFT